MSSLSRKVVACFLMFVLWSFAPLGAQDAPGQSPEQSMEEADRLYQAENWGSAVDAYEGITTREPTNQRAWFRLGMSLYRLGKYRKAVSAFEKAEQNGVPGWERPSTQGLPKSIS
jgi:tetratricopeptide (TPR) repeat protein